ncbi:uncharacterized protein LOC112341403 [Selaginella moellendorffii]|uniref:uncharacterized protein LOC112341403 n=1 Tax=Selaginella moellendorffii TaxID=88036 RepID=UPI000D1C43E1|nr:uncharacterized protein LOC112341403 [Selaginella moellendorffii]|eukprot:XP_024517195.1 uncharacterized protein LOC112341403 [Selaginella moellendorffii]
MCPLRFILVFLSATLAGYFAWKNLWGASAGDDEEQIEEEDSAKQQESSSLLDKVCSKTSLFFWTFVDMASGRYLWQNLVAKQSKTS